MTEMEEALQTAVALERQARAMKCWETCRRKRKNLQCADPSACTTVKDTRWNLAWK